MKIADAAATLSSTCCTYASISDRLVHRKQMAELVVGDYGLDLLAGQQVAYVRFKRGVELHHVTRLAGRHVVGVQVEHHVAAVGLDLVHIEELHVGKRVPQAIEPSQDLIVSRGVVSLLQVFVHLGRVYLLGHEAVYALGVLNAVLHLVLPKQVAAAYGHGGKDDDDTKQQGHKDPLPNGYGTSLVPQCVTPPTQSSHAFAYRLYQLAHLYQV